jgi:DNA-binding XRE family transcriptional regulator
MSQQEVAAKLGISQTSISKMETGKLEISAPLWFSFCELLCLDCECLIIGYHHDSHLLRIRAEILRGSCAFSDPMRLLRLAEDSRQHQDVQMTKIAESSINLNGQRF